MYNPGNYSVQSLPCLTLLLAGQSLENKSGYLPSLLPNSCLSTWAFLVAQTVKNLPAMRETWVRSLGWEDPLEEGMATHPSILAWRIPMDRGTWQATVYGVTKSEIGLSN